MSMSHVGRWRRVRGAWIFAFASVAVGSFQNCSGKFLVLEREGLSSTTSPASLNSETAISLSGKITCQFIGPDVLSDRLKSIFNITNGDVPVLDASGTATKKMRIDEALVTLGKGDVNDGRSDDWSCGTTKFKAAAEVMVDACALALADEQVREKLFPSGVPGFDSLYHHLLGRLPSAFESDVLAELMTKMSADRAEAALCGAVATSFESLIRI